jgi:dTDP-4-amino-4,6-dideoxygalactose transaminase
MMNKNILEVAQRRIPFSNLKAQDDPLQDEIAMALQDILASACFTQGPYVHDFEAAFAKSIGSKHCIGVNSGTSALHLALLCAGVEAGDEVITVPMTFIATAWAIRYLGAKPVFVDIDPSTYTMDIDQVESKITSRTRAILPVHLYGQPADLGPLQAIADLHGLALIEDAAQAHGALYRDRPAGSFGLCGCFSFYPGKNLGAYGEAGAVVTDDDSIAHRMRSLRDHAQSQRYHHDELGFNYRMDAFQGAVLGIKLRQLGRWIEQRRQIAHRYHELLSDLPLTLPGEAVGRRHAWHVFVAFHPERDRLRAALEERNIQTGLHYPIPLHLQKAFADLGHVAGDFPVSERVAQECFSLPMFPDLIPHQQRYVADTLHEVLSKPFDFQI